VRSALLAVKGVSRAQVTLEPAEAVVTYDTTKASVKDLINAVNSAEGPNGPRQYTAKEKPAKQR
jgi:copper chaperone CopZ